jgi:hypothetical protein
MKYYEIMKLKRAKAIISNKEYYIGRADRMNDKVQHYKMLMRDATTTTERMFFLKMVGMYMRRYVYYVYKELR